VRLNRRYDAQFFLVVLAWLITGFSAVLLVSRGVPVAIGIDLVVVAVFLAWLADVLTVRLVVAGTWRGWRGYEV
jgi:hypothetical protein